MVLIVLSHCMAEWPTPVTVPVVSFVFTTVATAGFIEKVVSARVVEVGFLSAAPS